MQSDFKKQLKKDLRKKITQNIDTLSFEQLLAKTEQLREIFETYLLTPCSPQLSTRYMVSFYPFETEPQINLEMYPLNIAYVRITDWNHRKMVSAKARRDLPGEWEELTTPISIFQPSSVQEVLTPNQIAAILVPGLAFDREGRRLGRGKGFYDQYLKEIPEALRIGVAFHEQMMPDLKEYEDAWDEKVDVILTDQELITTKNFGTFKNHGIVKSRNP